MSRKAPRTRMAVALLLFVAAAAGVYGVRRWTPAQAVAVASVPDPVSKPLRVLIVPGHEPTEGGAVFQGVKERDLNVAIGGDLERLLANDPRFQVTMARDTNGWNPVFSAYFSANWDAIQRWEQAAKQAFQAKIAKGLVKRPVSVVGHNDAPLAAATRLYGIVKWADENAIDIVVHIHFNDDPAHRHDLAGSFSGFAVYEPVPAFGNYARSHAVAEQLMSRLKAAEPVSNLPQEAGGLIDDPDLIAVGEYDTAKTASVLVEYAYLYEPKIMDPTLRGRTLETFAEETYQALVAARDAARRP